jgi:hypothetical protein
VVRYRILSKHEVSERISCIAYLVVTGASLHLRIIQKPDVRFIVQDRAGELLSDSFIDGCVRGNKLNRTIYLAANLTFDDLIITCAHEVQHVADYDNGRVSDEVRAEQFATDSWGPYMRGQSYFDILRSLGEMNARVAVEEQNEDVLDYSVRLLRAAKSSAADLFERELNAIRDQKYKQDLELRNMRSRIYEEIKKRAMCAKPIHRAVWAV